MTRRKQIGARPAENDGKQQNPYDVELPSSIIESFARFLVPEIRKFYDSEQGKKEFGKWQEAQVQSNKK